MLKRIKTFLLNIEKTRHNAIWSNILKKTLTQVFVYSLGAKAKNFLNSPFKTLIA